MSKAGVPYQKVKTDILLNEEVQIEYDELRTRYEIISQIIEARKACNMTQAELAKKIGTQRSNISRLESGTYNPSLDFLVKVVHGLNKNLTLSIH